MNQLRLYHIYTWKCHNESPCIAILNEHFFFYKKRKWGGKTGPVYGTGTSMSRRGEDIREGCRRVNMLEIQCIVCKWKNEIF
jgi:hypothetical protein